MRVAYIGLYTLTDAQRARELLGHIGIRACVTRMPAEKGVSCAFGLKLPAKDAAEAKQLLENKLLRLGKIVYLRDSGSREHDLL